MKETSSSGGAGRFRQQFEDVVRRRLSNPVQQSSSRLVGKLLDKTITLGTLTKETLASPMLKFRRSTGGGPGPASSQHQLSRISELDLTTSCSTSFATPKSSMLSASSQSVRASTSTPMQLNRPLQQVCPSQTTTNTTTPSGGRMKTRSDSFNVLNRSGSSDATTATTTTTATTSSSISGDDLMLSSPCEMTRRMSADDNERRRCRLRRGREVIFSMDYLNRSFDGVETMPSDGEDNHNNDDDDDEDDDVDDVDVFDVEGEEEEEDEKLANYRKLISEMNRTFEEKFARSNAAAAAANTDVATTDNNKNRNQQLLKKLDVKGEIL